MASPVGQNVSRVNNSLLAKNYLEKENNKEVKSKNGDGDNETSEIADHHKEACCHIK